MTTTTSNELLQQLLAGQSDGGSAAELLGQHEDPRVRLVAKLWAEQQAATTEDEPEPPAPAVLREPPSPAPALVRAVQQRGEQLRQFAHELRWLRELADTLAEALGACYLCWGDDPECEQCRGAGRPGWHVPHPPSFREYIGPALRRVKAAQNERLQRSDTQGTSDSAAHLRDERAEA